MSRIQWDESYSVGVTELDLQHTRWIELINILHDVLMGRRDLKEFSVLECLEAMVKYTQYHLRFEEKMLAKAGYQQLKEHVLEHERWEKQLCQYLVAEKEGQTMLTSEVMALLMTWLNNHILESDMAYRECLSKGICD